MTELAKGPCEAFRNASIASGNLFRWISRSDLPVKSSKTDFNVWSFVKQCIGKDLTKISMPVELNEPLSFLQRVAEYMEYSDLLKEASNQNDPIRRMEYVCAFAVSATASNHERVGKPFNPLLGETYELHHNGFMLVAEQVSHHPPVTAVHVEAKDYCLWATVQFKLRFWGKSIEVQSKGSVTLRLLQYNELYTWQYPNLVVHNVLMGKLWLEHVGPMHVINHTLDLACHLEFHPAGWFNALSDQVTGQIVGPDRQPVRQLFGDWTRGLFSVEPPVWNERHVASSTVVSVKPSCARQSTDRHPNRRAFTVECESPAGSTLEETPRESVGGSQFGFDLALPDQRCLWLARPRSSNAPHYYNFTQFAIGLNELNPQLAEARFSPVPDGPQEATYCGRSNGVAGPIKLLPPTDSRLRPDVRALELGQLKVAASEKDRLEEKQRHAIKHASRSRDTSSKSVTATTISTRRSLNGGSTSNSHFSHDVRNRNSESMVGPVWFTRTLNDVTGQDEWLFTGDYWARDWSHCPDLF